MQRERERHERKRTHRIANEFQTGGEIRMRRDELQLHVRDEPKKARPENHPPDPAEDEREHERNAHEYLPPGRRESRAGTDRFLPATTPGATLVEPRSASVTT